MNNSKKAVGPVIAIALFLVVTIVSVITFQNWYGIFQSENFVKVETQSDSISNLNILQLFAGKLYVESESSSNVNVILVKINDRDCGLSSSISNGINTLNVSICLGGMTDSEYDVVIVTNEGVFNKKFFSDDRFTSKFAKIFNGVSAGYDLIETSDNNFVLISEIFNSDFDILLIKTDSNGDELWNVSFDSGNDEWAYTLIETSDGGYGFIGDMDNGVDYDMRIIKTNSSGSELWNVSFDSGNDEFASSFFETSDEGFGLFGLKYNGIDYDYWLIRTNSSGSELWNVSFDSGVEDQSWDIIETSDGGFGLLGYTTTGFNRDFWLIRTNSSGSELWNVSFDSGSNSDYGYSLVETSDGGFGLFGSSNNNFWLIKINGSGSELWNLTFDGGATDQARSMVGTSDEGFGLIGFTYNGVDFDCWLIQLDSTGNQLWNVSFDTGNSESCRNVVQTNDEGFGLLGLNDGNLWFIKTDENGLTCDYSEGGEC